MSFVIDGFEKKIMKCLINLIRQMPFSSKTNNAFQCSAYLYIDKLKNKNEIFRPEIVE